MPSSLFNTIGSLTGGLQTPQQAGPGQGIYGAQDTYRPPTPRPAVLGASTSNAGSPQQPSPNNNYAGFPMESTPAQPSVNWDEIYAPAFQELDSAKSAYESALPSDYAQVDAQAASAKGGIDLSQKTGEDQIAQSKAEKAAESRASEADTRRMGAQLQQGLQSRFGGTTGTGQFLGEILGSGTIRSIAELRGAYTKAVGALDSALYQSKLQYDYLRQQVDQSAEGRKAELLSTLRKTLADLSTQRAGLQVDKGNKRASALETYRQELNAVNSRNDQTKQALYQDWVSTAQNLASKKAATEAERNKYEYSASDTYFQTLSKAKEAFSKMSGDVKFTPAGVKSIEDQYHLPAGTFGLVTDKNKGLNADDLLGVPSQAISQSAT